MQSEKNSLSNVKSPNPASVSINSAFHPLLWVNYPNSYDFIPSSYSKTLTLQLSILCPEFLETKNWAWLCSWRVSLVCLKQLHPEGSKAQPTQAANEIDFIFPRNWNHKHFSPLFPSQGKTLIIIESTYLIPFWPQALTKCHVISLLPSGQTVERDRHMCSPLSHLTGALKICIVYNRTYFQAYKKLY